MLKVKLSAQLSFELNNDIIMKSQHAKTNIFLMYNGTQIKKKHIKSYCGNFMGVKRTNFFKKSLLFVCLSQGLLVPFDTFV